MNKLTAFLRSLRWTFKFSFDIYKEIFRVSGKNAHVTLALARQRAINNQLKRIASSGTESNAFYAYHQFREIQEFCLKYNHIPENIIEIGTGSNLAILSLFLHSTAKKAYGLDIEPLDNRYDSYLYSMLKDYLKSTGGMNWYQYAAEHNPNPYVSFPTSIDEIDFEKYVNQVEYFAPCGADEIPLKDNSVDLFYSISTMEHLPHTGESIREMKRLLIQGGLAIHEIDMSYHRHHPNRLELLKYSDDEWNRLTNQYGDGLGVDDIWKGKFKKEIFCNRLRTSDFVQLFTEHGFEILEVTPTITFDPTQIDIKAFDKKFAQKTVEDLSVTNVIIVARCKK